MKIQHESRPTSENQVA